MPDPVLDSRTFARLAEELASQEAAVGVAHLYRENLTSRVDHLDTAFTDGDAETAMEAVLTLKVTSAMIGAAALQHCAETVEAALVRGDGAAAQEAIGTVRATSQATLSALNALLGD